MQISRRSFLKYCGGSAALLGLTPSTLNALNRTLTSPGAPQVLWLQGAGCSGCSVSFLNYVSTDPTLPADAADILINLIDLAYHPTLMAGAGQTAVNAMSDVYDAGGYVLIVEGGVPTAFGGHTCFAWSEGRRDVTFLSAVQRLADRAAAVICAGSCSSYGGIPAAPPNPTGIQSVSEVIGSATINVPGCPPHPNWLVHVLAEFLAGNTIPLDGHGRPSDLFNSFVHRYCPYKQALDADNWGQFARCKEDLGCRGKSTTGPCALQPFNEDTNWCIGSGGGCIGCTEPGFPGTAPLYRDQ